MKLILSAFLLTCTLFGTAIAQGEATKHALIIAIGDYPENPEEQGSWSDISSANDVPLIKGALESQKFTNFTVLINEQATKEGILTALENMRISVKKGDVVVIHFSSHGQQIMDFNGDELDGLDESIVAYNAPVHYIEGYKGEEHLVDEELGDALVAIRRALGENGDLLVLVDSCHSGTATRGEEKSRGGEEPMVPNGFKKSFAKPDIGMYEKKEGSGNVSPMVVISGSKASEVNHEFEGRGSLSVAFSRSFKNLNDNYSYRSLFSKIVKEMSLIAPDQTPTIEGDVDRKLFGGEVVNQEPYYTLKSLGKDEIQINGGIIHGINVGTTVKIFDAGTPQTEGEEPIAIGEVTEANNFDAFITVNQELNKNKSEYWVFVDQISFGDLSISLSIDASVQSTVKTSLNTFIESFPLGQVSESPDFIVEQVGNTLTLRKRNSGEIFKSGIEIKPGYKKLKGILSNYAQGKFLKELELSNPDYTVELRLIPATFKNKKFVKTLPVEGYMTEGGMIGFAPGDTAILEITNNGVEGLYFNIIDIQPDGQVNPVIPGLRGAANVDELYVEAGKTVQLQNKLVRFGPPYGTETFKLIASSEPLNLAPIFMTKGHSTGTRGSLDNSLEKLFQDSFSMTRGATVDSFFGGEQAGTFSYTFKIVERK
jgi:hypothetical protein